MTAAFFFSQNINLTFELRVRMNGTWFCKNLTTFDFFAVDTTEQSTNVITSSSAVKHLTEHFDTSYNRLFRLILETNDFNRIVHLQFTTLNTARSNSTTASDREYVLDRHQERFIRVTSRSWNVLINSSHELTNVLNLLSIAFESLKSRTCNNRNVIAWELIARKELTNFHLNEFKQFRIVNLVNFVQEYNDCWNANLTSKQDMLTSLRHWAISCGYNQDSTIHLSSTSDHVLYIVSMARAVNVCIVTVSRLILNVCRVDRNTAFTLFWSFIDICIILECSFAAFSLGQNLSDCSRQRRLAMVNVTNRTDVNMRFSSFKLFFSHLLNFLPYSPLFLAITLSAIFLGTSS